MRHVHHVRMEGGSSIPSEIRPPRGRFNQADVARPTLVPAEERSFAPPKTPKSDLDPGFGANLQIIDAPDENVVVEKRWKAANTLSEDTKDAYVFDEEYPDENLMPIDTAGLAITEKNDPNRGSDAIPENDVSAMDETDSLSASIKTRKNARRIRPLKHRMAKPDTEDAANIEALIDEGVNSYERKQDPGLVAEFQRITEKRGQKESIGVDSFVEKEIVEISQEVTKSSESWFSAMSRGAREIASGAGSFLKEVIQNLDDDSQSISKNGVLNWARGMLSMRGKKGEYLEFSTAEEEFFDGKTVVDTRQKNVLEHGLDSGYDIAHKLVKTPGEIYRGVSEILGTFAHSLDEDQEFIIDKSFAAMDTLANRPRAIVEAPLYVAGGFIKKALESAGKLSGKDRQEYNLMLKEITEAEKAFESQEFVGDGDADYFTDSGNHISQTMSWIAEQCRRFEAPSSQAVEANYKADLQRQSLDAAANRLEVAAAESNENAQEAERAQVAFSNEALHVYETYQKAIDEAEAKLVRRNKLLNEPGLEGRDRDRVKSDMARLERDIDKYEVEMAALKSQIKDAKDTTIKAEYKTLLAEVKNNLKQTKDKMTQLTKALENPKAVKGRARERAEDMMHQYNIEADAYAEKAQTYEAILNTLQQLENVTPDTRKESAVA